MRARHPIGFRFAGLGLLAYLAIFVVLSADTLVRLWLLRGSLDSTFDAALLLCYQLAHATTTLLALGIAAGVMTRAATAATRTFSLLLIFAAIAYTKAFAFQSFPGHLQEWIAARIAEAGFPRGATIFVFGAPAWAAWLGLGALLRISVLYPTQLGETAIIASARNDRLGLMRSVALAGVDIGALWRSIAAATLRRGWLRGRVVWPAAGALALASTALPRGEIGRAALATACAAAIALAITNLRAGLCVAGRLDSRRLLWIVQASITALVALALSAILSLTEDPAAGILSFCIAAVAPLAVLLGIACGATRVRPSDPRPAIRNTASWGGLGVTSAAVYIAVRSIGDGVGAPAVAHAAAGVAAAVTAALIVRRTMQNAATRIVK